MPAGSALVYSGRLWHAAGQNSAETTRRALICEHVLPWLRPADNHILATGVDVLRSLAPGLRRLAGVAIYNDQRERLNRLWSERESGMRTSLF